MALNPNWPVMEFAVSFAAGPSQTPVQNNWCEVTPRTEGSVSVKRGKQYELDQVQPGEMTLSLRNDDGAFDPTNTASPFYPFVVPYRLIRMRAQWSPTINLLTPEQATAWFSFRGLFTGALLPQWISQVGTQQLSIVNGTGINQYQVAYSGAAATSQGMGITGFSVAPSTTYAFRLTGLTGSAVAISMRLAIQWFNSSGTLISTTLGAPVALTTTAATVTVVGTAPVNAAGAMVRYLNTTSPGSSVHVLGRNLQMEKAAASTSYVQPGRWYNVFTGYVERWPQHWVDAGNRGLSSLTCIDQFTFFANRGMQNVFTADLLALNPNFLYALNESEGTQLFQDSTNKRGPARFQCNLRANTIAAGSSIESPDGTPYSGPDKITALTAGFLGSPGPVVTNAYPSSGILTGPGSQILIPPDPATGLPGTPQGTGFTRLIAARANAIPSGAHPNPVAWGYAQLATLDIFTFFLVPYPAIPPSTGWAMAGECSQNAAGGGGAAETYFQIDPIGSLSSLHDADWHLYGISLSADGKTMKQWIDTSSLPLVTTTATSMNPRQDRLGADCIGNFQDQAVSGTANSNWQGDLAYVCELPFEMDGTTWQNLGRSWRNAWSTTTDFTETSDARYNRILDWVGYSGARRIQAGNSVAYGPATDIAGGDPPVDALTCLQAVVDTEVGQHYIGNDGAIVFLSRAARYNQVTPTVTFGEDVAGGEIPYTELSTDFDPTRIANYIDVAAQYGSVVSHADDATSIATYGQVTLSRTANSVDQDELISQSQYLLYQNKQPQQRMEALPVNVGAHPSVWPSLLALELGAIVAVNRRPSNAPAISFTGFIEQITWEIGDDLSAKFTAQVSSNALHTFFMLDDPALGLLDSSLLGY